MLFLILLPIIGQLRNWIVFVFTLAGKGCGATQLDKKPRIKPRR
jgi:hypothetical protein